MEWPSSIMRGVLEAGPFIGTAGKLEKAQVWIEPLFPGGVTHLVHAPTGHVLTPFNEPVEVGTEPVQVELPICDDPNWVRTDGAAAGEWSYRVNLYVHNEQGLFWTHATTVKPTVDVPFTRITGPASAPDQTPIGGNAVTVEELKPGTYKFTGLNFVELAPGSYQLNL